ncbi:MAG: response regulator [Rhodospirillales bacterium]|nr:response regulator [Rhodospirillales bacterium]MDH3792692.1 response regulator [Rhodospirillales bacterium]MDH3912951.1 response regulator [Rhodospirillales bacterium]MDH3918878.1 response regulator [Rhodospirillales bacterium]MDH3968218.1 response regulator [Rhodospirillales bacterium]
MHVLLVEDDEVLTPIVEAALREAGHTCETTEQGAQAVALAKQNRYDVMVVDADLPDMEGCQVVRLLKVEGIDIPVVMQSGVMDLNLPFVAASLGVKKFLTKPFSARELIGHMEAVAGTPGQGVPDAAPAPGPVPGPAAGPAAGARVAPPPAQPAPPQPAPGPRPAPMPAAGNIERRGAARAKVYQAALILDGDRQIPCVILDRSERGGALRITDPDQPCPTLFTLKPLDGPECRCEVRWRRGDRIGVEFR